ncbi:hypothetical protein MOKP125_25360 [Mycobacterium avium subsp. hominissuis]
MNSEILRWDTSDAFMVWASNSSRNALSPATERVWRSSMRTTKNAAQQRKP